MKALLCNGLFLLLFIPIGFGTSGDEPTVYKTVRALGWKIKINSKFYEGDTSILRKSFKLFGEELTAINDILPKRALDKLYGVVFWLEDESKLSGHTGMYIGRGGIVVSVTQYYAFKTSDNEWVIMHELAHAYHDRVIGFDDEKIIRTYKLIKQAGLYKDVQHRLSSYAHGYALKNAHEYFAEISTCYFGINNYYPHDRADLRHYDPIGYALVEEMWHVKNGVEVE
jgi:hypothetical protein